MRTHFCQTLLVAAVMAGAGGVQAQELIEYDYNAGPAETVITHEWDGTVITRETYYEPDGTVVTRESTRTPPPPAVVFMSAQRRLIVRAVARPGAAPVAREDYMVPAGIEYRVGVRSPEAVVLHPFPARVRVGAPALGRYRYALYEDRVLVVDPATRIVVQEIVE